MVMIMTFIISISNVWCGNRICYNIGKLSTLDDRYLRRLPFFLHGAIRVYRTLVGNS